MIAEPSRSVVDRGAGVEDTRAIFPSDARAIHVTHKPIYRALGIENVKHRHGAHQAPSAAINGLHANPSRVSELYEALIAAGAPRWQAIGLLHRFGGYQVGKLSSSIASISSVSSRRSPLASSLSLRRCATSGL